MCFPDLAEAELAAELASYRREQEQAERRSAGMVRCPEHDQYDGCFRFATRRELGLSEQRTLSWQDAMDRLWARYVPPA
jgi:hypothetical protein